MSLGATWAHYNGKVTRTAALGKVSPEAEKRLKTVIDAQEAAFDAAKPGNTIGCRLRRRRRRSSRRVASRSAA